MLASCVISSVLPGYQSYTQVNTTKLSELVLCILNEKDKDKSDIGQSALSGHEDQKRAK